MEINQEMYRNLYINLYKAQNNISKFSTRSNLKQHELTYPQYLILNILWNDEPVKVVQIVELLGADTGTVSPLLKRMESKNLIKRLRSDVDQREVIIYLTEKGKNLESVLDKSVYEGSAISSLSSKEIIELNSLLLKIIE